MKLENLLEDIHEEELNEGIKFFKTSKKIKSAIKKVKKELYKLEDEQIEPVRKFILKAEQIANKFDALENLYRNAKTKQEKQNLKLEYKLVEEENNKLISMIKQEDFKKVLKGSLVAIGIVAIILSALSFTGVLSSLAEESIKKTAYHGGKAFTYSKIADVTQKVSNSGANLETIAGLKSESDKNKLLATLWGNIARANNFIMKNETKAGLFGAGTLGISNFLKIKSPKINKFVSAMKELEGYEKNLIKGK